MTETKKIESIIKDELYETIEVIQDCLSTLRNWIISKNTTL